MMKMYFTLAVFVLLISGLVSLIICLTSAVHRSIRLRKSSPADEQSARMKKSVAVFAGTAALIAILAVISQQVAHTPKMSGADSIAELTKVELNGRKEWISIRGSNRNNPVLLFLAGGPGGTQMASERNELGELEKYFVVVNWDQPGSGKSYAAISEDKITPDTYIKDGLALTDLLRERFGKDKIYLMGESWGSALGIFLADAAPEKYSALIGTGQMVDFRETEIEDYSKAMELAEEKGDAKTLKKLKSNGAPPYYGSDVTWKSAVYLSFLSEYMTKNPDITDGGFHTLRDMFAPEYGVLDSVNYFRGLVGTFNHVYPQLYDTDLRKGFTKIDIPVYFFLGKYDVNAPAGLVREYYDKLEAPKKEIILFEHSGHDPWMNESGLFVKRTVRTFLGQEIGA